MKRETQNILSVIGMGILIAVASVNARASLIKIQFDMGRLPSAITQSVGSPGLTTGAFTASDTTWNGVTYTTPSYTSLKYSDSTTATGVTAQYGSTAVGSPNGVITWNSGTNLSNTVTGNGGLSVYSNNMAENLTYFATNTSGGGLGFRVNGLSPGIYDVYVTSVNTGAITRTYDIGAGVNLAQQVASPSPVSANATTNAWVAGTNYIRVSSIGINSTSDWLTVISSINSNNFPVINGIQIVETAVPEPASLSLLAAGGLLVLRRRRA